MSCSCGQSNCQCNSSPCAPANSAYQAACTDPGSVNAGAYVSVRDNQFCERRLLNAPGTLVARQNGSGGWEIVFTNEPVFDLTSFQAVINQPFGDFVVEGSDGILRYMLAPAQAGLVPTTLANGDVVWAVPPSPTVPDPLTITTINATNANFANLIVTGATPQFTGLSTGVATFALGLNATNQLIKLDPNTTTPQSVTFFEAPTSPSATTPNSGATAGSLLIIGNETDSSTTVGALISVTTSQTLTVVLAGYYNLDWCGGAVMNANTGGTPSIQLLINGVIVNNGSTRAGPAGTPNRTALSMSGIHGRRLPVGTTIQLQLAAGSGSNLSLYEVRLRATRLGA